jgi:TonB family protein
VPPLRLDVYTMATPADSLSAKWASIVVPTLSAVYRMTAWRNGTVTQARVVGGARIDAFDAAFLAAVKSLSDSTVFPLFPSSIAADSIDLRIAVRQDHIATLAARDPGSKGEAPIATKSSTPSAEPLFRMKVPMLGRGNTASGVAGQQGPRYPEIARNNNVEGDVEVEFVLREDGMADRLSVAVSKATALEFAESVLDRLPQMRFKPMELNGCPLAEIVSMPFQFRLRRF